MTAVFHRGVRATDVDRERATGLHAHPCRDIDTLHDKLISLDLPESAP